MKSVLNEQKFGPPIANNLSDDQSNDKFIIKI